MAIDISAAIISAQKSINKQTKSMAYGTSIVDAKDDAAGAAISTKLKADIAGLGAGVKNAEQGASVVQSGAAAYDKISNELIRMREIATQVRNGAIQSSERTQANAEFQQRIAQVNDIASTTRLLGLSLLTGGGGATTSSGAVTEANTAGMAAIANALAANIDTTSTGFIDGSASSILVTGDNTAGFSISMQVGNQIFSNTATGALTTDASVTLTSTSNSANTIVFKTAGAAVTSLTAATITTYLTGSTFVSGSAALDAKYSAGSFTSGAATTAGTYSLSFANATDSFTLTNGAESWTVKMSKDALQTVEFGNGLSFQTSATFDRTADLAQTTLVVAQGSTLSLDFQTNIKSTDISTVAFVSATATALGLGSSDVLTTNNAATALAKISTAIDTLNVARANIGALQARFESIIDNNNTQIEGLKTIEESFSGLDMAKAQSTLVDAQVAKQAAIAMAAQANQDKQLVLRLLQ